MDSGQQANPEPQVADKEDLSPPTSVDMNTDPSPVAESPSLCPKVPPDKPKSWRDVLKNVEEDRIVLTEEDCSGYSGRRCRGAFSHHRRRGYECSGGNLVLFFDLWKPTGRMRLVDLPDGYYIVKFDKEQDYAAVLMGGPWVLFGHYVTIKQWSPCFNPLTDSIKTTPAWIRFVDLPRTLVEYEGLSTICFRCGRFGHFQPSCPLEPINIVRREEAEKNRALVSSGQASPSKDQEKFGEWMNQETRRKAQRRRERAAARNQTRANAKPDEQLSVSEKPARWEKEPVRGQYSVVGERPRIEEENVKLQETKAMGSKLFKASTSNARKHRYRHKHGKNLAQKSGPNIGKDIPAIGPIKRARHSLDLFAAARAHEDKAHSEKHSGGLDRPNPFVVLDASSEKEEEPTSISDLNFADKDSGALCQEGSTEPAPRHLSMVTAPQDNQEIEVSLAGEDQSKVHAPSGQTS
ncbi:hypothetical protein V2J09_019424 [Rumex salicifolius]